MANYISRDFYTYTLDFTFDNQKILISAFNLYTRHGISFNILIPENKQNIYGETVLYLHIHIKFLENNKDYDIEFTETSITEISKYFYSKYLSINLSNRSAILDVESVLTSYLKNHSTLDLFFRELYFDIFSGYYFDIKIGLEDG